MLLSLQKNNSKTSRTTRRSIENFITFANPMTIKHDMETITLSYEADSDFAKALDELICNSEGVRVVNHNETDSAVYDQEDDAVLLAVVKERIRQLEAGEVETIPNEKVFADVRERYGF